MVQYRNQKECSHRHTLKNIEHGGPFHKTTSLISYSIISHPWISSRTWFGFRKLSQMRGTAPDQNFLLHGTGEIVYIWSGWVDPPWPQTKAHHPKIHHHLNSNKLTWIYHDVVHTSVYSEINTELVLREGESDLFQYFSTILYVH